MNELPPPDPRLPPAPSPGPPPAPKLAVGSIIGAAFSAVFANPRAYARAAFVPFVIGVAVAIVMLALGIKLDPQQPTVPDLLGFIASGIVTLVVMMTFYTKTCRIVLGPQLGDAPLEWVWQPAEWRCLGYFILLTLVFGFLAGFVGALLFIAIGGVPGLFLAFWAVLGMMALFSRFLFVFPAVAAGHPTGLGIAWRQTRGNAWRLIGIYILFGLIMTGAQIPVLLVGLLALHLAEDAPFVQLAFNAVARAFSLGLYAVFLTGLSVAYGRVTGYTVYLPTRYPPANTPAGTKEPPA